jgi:hypothetical protein
LATIGVFAHYWGVTGAAYSLLAGGVVGTAITYPVYLSKVADSSHTERKSTQVESGTRKP